MVLDLKVWVKKTGVWEQTEESVNLNILQIARYRKVHIQVGKKHIECTRVLFADGDILYMAGKHDENKQALDEAIALTEAEREGMPQVTISAN